MSTAKQMEMGLGTGKHNGHPTPGAIRVTMSPGAWLALEIIVSPDVIDGPYQDDRAPALTHATMTRPKARLARHILRKTRTSPQPLPGTLQEITGGSALDAVIWAEHELDHALSGNPLSAQEWQDWVENRS